MAAASSRHIEVLLPTGATVVTGAAALTGTGTLAAAGTRTRFGAAALTGTGTQSAAAVRTAFGAGALTGTGTQSAAGTRSAVAAAALQGNGTLTSNGTRVRFGASSLTGTGSLAADGTVISTVPTPAAPVGGPLFTYPPPRRKRKKLNLSAACARVHLRALSPRLTIGTTVVLPSIRTTAHAPAPCLTLTSRASVAHTIYRATPDHRTRQLNTELAQLTEEILLIT